MDLIGVEEVAHLNQWDHQNQLWVGNNLKNLQHEEGSCDGMTTYAHVPTSNLPEMGKFVHACEGELVCKSTNAKVCNIHFMRKHHHSL